MADTNQPQEHTPYQDDPSQPPPEPAELPSASTSPAPHIRRLTLVSASLAFASFLFGIPFIVLLVISEHHGAYTPWELQNRAVWLIFVVILTSLLSGINANKIRHSMPLPLNVNLFLDLVIALVALLNGIPSVAVLGDNTRGGCGYGWNNSGACYPLKLASSIVGIIVISLVVLFGIVHLVLFMVRATALYRSGNRSRSWTTLTLPTGQMTFELSFKLYKKPEPTVGQQSTEGQAQESLV